MRRLAVLFGAMLFATASSSTASQNASPAEACAVLQAVFSSGTGLPPDGYPKSVQPYEPRAFRGGIGPYLKNLGLSQAETNDLVERARLHNFGSFEPSCKWKGRPVSVQNEDGAPILIGFSDPLFSSNGRLALVEWSMTSSPRGGSGDICLARKSADGWTVRCDLGWIS